MFIIFRKFLKNQDCFLTLSEIELDYQHKKLCIGVASRINWVNRKFHAYLLGGCMLFKFQGFSQAAWPMVPQILCVVSISFVKLVESSLMCFYFFWTRRFCIVGYYWVTYEKWWNLYENDLFLTIVFSFD